MGTGQMSKEEQPLHFLSDPREPKRRRVTRACDMCRHKKVKCDGKQPCIHCTVYLYKCTYDRPNIRNKNAPGPLPSTQLSLVLQLMAMNRAPLASTANANLVLCQNIVNLLLPKLRLNFLDDRPQEFDFKKFQRVVEYAQQKNPHQLNVVDIQQLYVDGQTPSALPNGLELHGLVQLEDFGSEFKVFLPPKDVALQLIFTTWNKACVLIRFYHRPSLLEEVELLYSLDPINYTNRQQKFLPFLYSVLACGLLFSRQTYNGNESLEDDGYKYFLEARKLIDITNVSDIPSIQTIVMMVLYLQCSARLLTCYLYIGIAMRSALKEGLHRDLSVFQSSKRKLDPIEEDTRKRLFYTIYKMDIYINSLLGLPRLIGEDEFDQLLPEELDDDNITREAYEYEKQNGKLSSLGVANHHTKLLMILAHVVKELYPIKLKATKPGTPILDTVHDRVTTLELRLKAWLSNLPAELKPTDPNDPTSSQRIPERFRLANYYLHLSFLSCQMNLYRPFIHFISNGSKSSDPRSLIRGRNCIKVARMVVKLANKMIDQNLLVGTYWFSMYSIFFSIACLIYYFHFANYNNQNKLSGANYAGVLFDDDLNIEMIRNDIEIGRKVLDILKNMLNSLMRIYNILNNLFEQLNRRTADTSYRANLMASSTLFTPNNESVKLTLETFDKINQYNGSESDLSNMIVSPIKEGVDMQQENEKNLNGKKLPDSEARPEEVKPVEVQDPTDIFSLFNNSLEVPSNVESLEYGADNLEASNHYVPGVIDTLDTQIFGRILPPYMLEGNKRGEPLALENLDMDFGTLDSLDPFNI